LSRFFRSFGDYGGSILDSMQNRNLSIDMLSFFAFERVFPGERLQLTFLDFKRPFEVLKSFLGEKSGD